MYFLIQFYNFMHLNTSAVIQILYLIGVPGQKWPAF